MLTLSCPDRTGIVARITTFLAEIGGWITEAAYHSDEETGRFFTRQEIRADSAPFTADELRQRFGQVAGELAADSWQVTDSSNLKTVVLLVSREGHCLYELLARWHSGELPARIGMVIGNHPDLEPVATLFGLPFRHIPVPRDDEGKAVAFEQIRREVDGHSPDAIVLARYMQVIPPDLCREWEGRLINIHHGFLPSFRGARPYHQAYVRGVKIIGATCHYVTRRARRGPDHRAERHPGGPRRFAGQDGAAGPGHRKGRAGEGFDLSFGEPRAAGRIAHDRVRLKASPRASRESDNGRGRECTPSARCWPADRDEVPSR